MNKINYYELRTFKLEKKKYFYLFEYLILVILKILIFLSLLIIEFKFELNFLSDI